MTYPPDSPAAQSSAVDVRHDQAWFSQLADIEAALHLELDSARDRLRRASKVFQHAISDLPSGLPGSDVSLVIKQAGLEKRRALWQLASAVRRFTAFLLDGLIPEDMRERLRF